MNGPHEVRHNLGSQLAVPPARATCTSHSRYKACSEARGRGRKHSKHHDSATSSGPTLTTYLNHNIAVMDSASVKQAVMQQVSSEANMANVRLLIEKLQENCFQKCVPKPGGSLSSNEQSCVTSCMEKYMAAWNKVNSSYIDRLRQEQGVQM